MPRTFHGWTETTSSTTNAAGGILLRVAVLVALRETAVAADLDRVVLCVVAERHGHDVRLATRVGRGDTPEALATEILELGRGEGALIGYGFLSPQTTPIKSDRR